MASSGKRKRNDDNKDANDLTIDGTYTIIVQTYNAGAFCLQVKGSETIISVKFKITDKFAHLPPEEQELIFNDGVLEDLDTLSDQRVVESSSLTLLRGRLEKMFINGVTDRPWPIYVKPSDTVGDLKVQISYRIDPHDPKELVILFNNIILDDCCILSNFHITVNTALTLKHKTNTETMEIFVKTLAGKTISRDVIAKTTIGQLKSVINDQEYIPEDEKVLVFNEMVLDDSSAIFDFGIKKGSTLTLMRVSKGLIQIFVNSENGMSRSFQVKPSDTIGDLKNQISDKVGIPVYKQVLIFNEMVLHDSGTLSDFDIKRESTLTLMSKSRELMQIFVTGMSKSIEVKPTDTIGNLKKQISDKVGIPIDKQVLVFNKMVLHDSGTLADFDIKTESTLTLMRKSTGLMQLFFRDCWGKEICVEVNPFLTILNLKYRLMMELKRFCDPDELGVVFNGRYLENSHTIGDYDIKKDDSIAVVFRLGGWTCRWGKGLKI